MEREDEHFLHGESHMSLVTVTVSSGKHQRHIFVGGQVGEKERRGNVKDNYYEYDAENETFESM